MYTSPIAHCSRLPKVYQDCTIKDCIQLLYRINKSPLHYRASRRWRCWFWTSSCWHRWSLWPNRYLTLDCNQLIEKEENLTTSSTTTMTLKVMEWPSSSRRLSGLRFVHISLINDLKQSIAIYHQQAQNNDLFSSVYDDSIAGSSTEPENRDHSKNGEALKSLYPYTKSVLLTPKTYFDLKIRWGSHLECG